MSGLVFTFASNYYQTAYLEDIIIEKKFWAVTFLAKFHAGKKIAIEFLIASARTVNKICLNFLMARICFIVLLSVVLVDSTSYMECKRHQNNHGA